MKSLDSLNLITSDKLQEMIQNLNSDTEKKEQFFELLNCSNEDKRAIRDVLNDGFYERFDRYDSDVSEIFINTYQKLQDARLEKVSQIQEDRYPDLITSAIEYLECLSKEISQDYVNEKQDSVEKFLLTTGVVTPIINDLKKLKDDYQEKFCKSLSIEEKNKLIKQATKKNKVR